MLEATHRRIRSELQAEAQVGPALFEVATALEMDGDETLSELAQLLRDAEAALPDGARNQRRTGR